MQDFIALHMRSSRALVDSTPLKLANAHDHGTFIKISAQKVYVYVVPCRSNNNQLRL